jgi:hypothetical protein
MRPKPETTFYTSPVRTPSLHDQVPPPDGHTLEVIYNLTLGIQQNMIGIQSQMMNMQEQMIEMQTQVNQVFWLSRLFYS